MRAVAGENLFIPGGCLAASAGSGAEPQGWILHEHPRKPSPYVNIRTSNRVITLTMGIINFSKDLQDKMYGDEMALRCLKNCEDRYSAGKREALFEALILCARFQAVIPEWAADAIIDGETALNSGECKDLNELFGGDELANQSTRKREARIRDNTQNVLGMLMKYRCEGGWMNAEQAFGEISEGMNLPRRDVEEIYRRSGKWVKDIPQGNPGGVNYCFGHGVIPWPRRRGRSVL